MKKYIFLLVLFLLAFSNNAFSAVKTWDGGGADANWQTAANWVGDVAPVAGDDLVFPASAAQQSTNNNFFFGTSFSSITIEGGNYTIGGNFFSLSSGINVTGGISHLVTTGISLSGGQTFTAAAGSTTTIVIITVSGLGLTLDGEGSFGIGLINGSGAVKKNGLGASLINSAGSYNGAITLNNGVLVVDANIPNSTVTINSTTTTGGPLGFSGFGGTGTVGATNVTQGVISAGTLNSPTGILNINNGLTFTANGNYICKIGGTTPGATGHDQLNVTGTVTLNNARLAPLPWNAFRPAIGDTFVILKNDGADAINGTFLNAPENAVFGGALNTAFRITYHGGDGNDVAITRVPKAIFDFDGDGKTDISIFRPAVGEWWILKSSNGANSAFQFGNSSDKLVPADFTGDNKTDVAFFRPVSGEWFILRSEDSSYYSFPFGTNGDVPVVGDFDGDGRADSGVFRPSETNWYIRRSLDGGTTVQQFGASGDAPVVGDYDGDGMSDIAIWRASVGQWWVRQSSDSGVTAFAFGTSADKPVQGDYTGDGKTDIAFWRGSTGEWFILRSEDLSFYAFPFGTNGDVPAPGDFDGDGKIDATVFRPSSNTWFSQRTTAGTLIQSFGQTGDVPVPSAFIP